MKSLAILVAMRLWRVPGTCAARACVTSDSLAASLALARGSSTAGRLGLILRELALEDAEQNSRIESVRHIPGLSNNLADSLSQLTAPEPHAVPRALLHARRDSLPKRSRSWYLTLDPGSGRREKRQAVAPRAPLHILLPFRPVLS